MTEHVKARNKLKNIYLVETFNQLLDSCILSDIEKEILKLHYLQDKDFRYIGDTLGYSESTIKRKHHKAIKKLSNLI